MPQLELLLLTEQSLRRGTMMNSCLLVLLVSVVCCNGAYPSTTSSVSAAFSRSWATRAFKNTPHGQIHYVYGGDFKATPSAKASTSLRGSSVSTSLSSLPGGGTPCRHFSKR